MLSCCLKCRKNTERENPEVIRTKNGRIMLLSICAVCDSEKSKFIKEQEASRLLSSLGIKILLSKIPLLCPLFIPQMHLRQPGFKYNACEPFTKNKERI